MESSIFATLPGELRNLIWEYALYEPTGVPINTHPGLLQTCKAIRSEAEQMFYAVNHFQAVIQEDNIRPQVGKWLQNLGEAKRKLIRGLQVHCVIASAATVADDADELTFDKEEDSFMQLMHLLDSIRGTDFGRPLEHVVGFTVSSNDENDLNAVFDDSKSFDEMDGMSLDEQECYRAAKFLILCCVYGKEILVDAMQAHDGVRSIAELDRRIQSSRDAYSTSMIAGCR